MNQICGCSFMMSASVHMNIIFLILLSLHDICIVTSWAFGVIVCNANTKYVFNFCSLFNFPLPAVVSLSATSPFEAGVKLYSHMTIEWQCKNRNIFFSNVNSNTVTKHYLLIEYAISDLRLYTM